jgi:putative ABC transport system permease protein
VVANTMAMTTRERFGEYAILKTLGFGGKYIAVLIFGESLVITLIGCVFGVVCTFPAARAFGEALPTFFPVFHVGAKTLSLELVASLVVALIAAIIPTQRAIAIHVAEALRRVG